MELNLIFHILGIAVTKDEDAIRNAYRTALKNNNPEDNPEGFKELRKAYEEALAYAKTPDEEPETTFHSSVSEINDWLEKAKQLYLDLPSRWDLSKWKILMEDDICQSIDTATEAKEQFLIFLMQYNHFPYSVWQYFNKTFYLLEDMDELRNKFPPDFLNYITFYIEHESFLPYECFVYRNPKDKTCEGDLYINQYFSIKQKIDEEDTKECYRLLDELSSFGLYHPYEDVERTRLLLMAGKKEEALSLGSSLLEKHPEDCYILLYAGLSRWKNGDREPAVEMWKHILEKRPYYYRAKLFLSQYYIEEELYYDAKDMIISLLETDNEDKEVLSSLTRVNDALIEILTNDMSLGRKNEHYTPEELPIEIGWCLFQNQRFDEAVSLLQGYTPTEETKYSYYNLFGRILYQIRRYQDALPLLEKWYACISSLTEDGTEETKKRISRYDMAVYILSDCYSELEKPKKAEELLLTAISKKEGHPEALEHENHLAEIYLKHKQYERAVDLCDKIIDIDSNYYPAYVIRQECFYHLDKGQEVVYDYHRAVSLYPSYYKPYMFACEVFIDHNQYEDANEVLELARKNEITFTPRMRLAEAKVLHRLAKTDQDVTEFLTMLTELQNEGNSPDCDIEDFSEVSYELGILYWDIQEFSKACDFIQRAIKENPSRIQYQVILGDILVQMENYKAALKAYEMGKKHYDDLPIYHYKVGICYDGLGDLENAVTSYTNALKLDDTYQDCNGKLADVYDKLYQETEAKKWIHLAILHAKKQLTITNNEYYHINLGRFFLAVIKLEEAMEEFHAALKLDSKSWLAWHNLSFCYRKQGDFKQAVSCLEKAIRFMKEANMNIQIPYNIMAECYEAMLDYEKAISCYETSLTLFPDNLSVWEEIGDLYSYMEKDKEAMLAYRQTGDSDLVAKNQVYFAIKKQKKISSLLALQSFVRGSEVSKMVERYHFLGEIFLDDMADYKKAAYYLQKALQYPLDMETWFEYEKDYALALYMLKRFEDAKTHARLAMKAFCSSPKFAKEEVFLDYAPYTPHRLCMLGSIYLALGDTNKALHLFSRMKSIPRCDGCRHSECFEYHLLMGHYFNIKGEKEKALSHYTKVLEVNPHCGTAQIEQKKLQK